MLLSEDLILFFIYTIAYKQFIINILHWYFKNCFCTVSLQLRLDSAKFFRNQNYCSINSMINSKKS